MGAIGIGIGTPFRKSNISWSSYWIPQTAVVENLASTDVVLTYDKKINPVDAIVGNFTIAGKTISSATLDGTGKILTLVVTETFLYGDTIVVVANSTNIPVTNNVIGGGVSARFELPLDATNIGHIDTFINTLVTAGVWSKLIAFYNFWIHDDEAIRVNWKSNTEYLTNFDANDPAFVIEQGIQGNGTAGVGPALKMASNLNSLIANNNWAQGAYIHTRSAITSRYISGIAATGTEWLLMLDVTATLGPYCYANGSITAGSGGAAPFMFGVTRDGNAVNSYKNGVDLANDSDAPSNLPAAPMHILGRKNAASLESNYDGILSCWYLATKLTKAEHLAITNAFTTWRTNFNV